MFYFISLFIVNQIDVVYRAPAGPGGERRIYMRKNFSQITTGKEMKQTIEENPIWIPLQTTYCKELQVAEFLRDSEAVLISFDKFVKHDLDECKLYHSFRSFSKEFVIDGQPSEVFQP